MRKVIWCCWAAVMLTAGSFLSLAYYACHCPNSVVGRSMQVIAEASMTMQPLSGISSMAMRTNRANATATPLGECIPDDPQPAARERKEDVIFQSSAREEEEDAAPIVIHEELPPEIPHSVVFNEGNFDMDDMHRHEVPPKGCPTAMPYCRDEEDEPANPPKTPRAEGGNTEPSVFKAWMELFSEGKDKKAPAVEELPAPKEEEQPQTEPKCQEDSHLHEQYPGCPRTTCPYTGKDGKEKYYQQLKALATKWTKGGEESSEEPNPSKDCKDKEQCPRTKGVDTMEYRKSDAGPEEYGPGQVH